MASVHLLDSGHPSRQKNPVGHPSSFKLPSLYLSEGQVPQRGKVTQCWLQSGLPSWTANWAVLVGNRMPKLILSFFPLCWAPLSSSAIYSSYFCMRLHFRTRKWWAYQRITHSLEIRGKNPNPFVLSCFASSVERETGQGIWSLKIKTTFSSLLAARWEQVTAS